MPGIAFKRWHRIAIVVCTLLAAVTYYSLQCGTAAASAKGAFFTLCAGRHSGRAHLAGDAGRAVAAQARLI